MPVIFGNLLGGLKRVTRVTSPVKQMARLLLRDRNLSIEVYTQSEALSLLVAVKRGVAQRHVLSHPGKG